MSNVNQLYKNKIDEINNQISFLKQEKKNLELQCETNKDKTDISKWVGFTFESSCNETQEFNLFIKDIKQYIKENIKNGFELVDFSKGHFYFSGFLQDTTTNKFVYFNSGDVRHFPDEWYKKLLIRTAKHAKDYTGGSNNFCEITEFNKKAKNLIK